ncbi:uncharacterized protein [Cebidichthys violaceus]|uniref:uncharacterized protein n=1 Tax=Cebidichthys violaceus TaxID=271503 RepID=UPI0035CBBAFE
MKPHSWLRRNWLWAAGGAFVSVHLATWLMQSAMRSAVRSEAAALKQKPAEETLEVKDGQQPRRRTETSATTDEL